MQIVTNSPVCPWNIRWLSPAMLEGTWPDRSVKRSSEIMMLLPIQIHVGWMTLHSLLWCTTNIAMDRYNLLHLQGNIHCLTLELHLLNLQRQMMQAQLVNQHEQERQAVAKRPARQWWVHAVNHMWEKKDYCNNLLRELKKEYWKGFYKIMQMYPNFFHYLGAWLMHRRQNRDTNWRKALPFGLQFGLNLHYLATNIDLIEVHSIWHFGYKTAGKVDVEAYHAIINEFQDGVVKTREWERATVSRHFKERWNLPHCLGALDANHYKISQAQDSASLYLNTRSSSASSCEHLSMPTTTSPSYSEYSLHWDLQQVQVIVNRACTEIYNKSKL